MTHLFRFSAFLLLAGLTLCVPRAMGQTVRYATPTLQQLAQDVKARLGLTCDRPLTAPCGQNQVRVDVDSLGQVCHIGWRIFPTELTGQNPSPVYRFVERYLLQLYVHRELPTPEQRLREDRVTLRFPGHDDEPLHQNLEQRLPRLDGTASLVVLTDNRCYTLTVYDGGQRRFFMRVPIRYELLWGMNKVEAEQGFYPGLQRFQVPKADGCVPLPPDEEPWLQPAEGGTFVLPGDSYWIDAMNDARTYRRTPDGRYTPVHDVRLPEASARNLFLLACDRGITVRVCQRLYNRRKLEFDVPLHRLLAYCRAQGCQPYVGIETVSQDEVTGTVVLQNPAYGYCHQLYFRLPLGLLRNPAGGQMQAELYAYVPTHNVESLTGSR